MLKVLQQILDDSVFEFQRANMRMARESLAFIIPWFNKVQKYSESRSEEIEGGFSRRRLLLTGCDVLLTEIRVLEKRVIMTMKSVQNDLDT